MGSKTGELEPQPKGDYSDKPTNPGYPIDKALKDGAYGDCSEEDLKRGYQKP